MESPYQFKEVITFRMYKGFCSNKIAKYLQIGVCCRRFRIVFLGYECFLCTHTFLKHSNRKRRSA